MFFDNRNLEQEVFIAIVTGISTNRGVFSAKSETKDYHLQQIHSRVPQFRLNGTEPLVVFDTMDAMHDTKNVMMLNTNDIQIGDRVVILPVNKGKKQPRLLWATKAIWDQYKAAAEEMLNERRDWSTDLFVINCGRSGSVYFPAPSNLTPETMQVQMQARFSTLTAAFKHRHVVADINGLRMTAGGFEIIQPSLSAPAKLFGIIPESAEDGFWAMQDNKWVRATPVVVELMRNSEVVETFIGLKLEDGTLLQRADIYADALQLRTNLMAMTYSKHLCYVVCRVTDQSRVSADLERVVVEAVK